VCLHRIHTIHEPPLSVVWAWKVFNTTGGLLFGRYFNKGVAYKRGRWYQAIKKNTSRFSATAGPNYVIGFHAYRSQSRARRHGQIRMGGAVVKVKLRGVRITGSQNGSTVYVADEMLIPGIKTLRAQRDAAQVSR
jgi:hypothetical protein